MTDEDNTTAPEASGATVITFSSGEQMVGALGANDEVLRILQGVYPSVELHVRGNELRITGEAAPAGRAEHVVREARSLAARGTRVSAQLVEQLIRMVESDGALHGSGSETFGLNILSGRGKRIRPKTVNQKAYVDAIDANTVIFGIGPAGTGKTYLAMAKAVQSLQAKEVSRIILTRPAVEAGEKLGFLPGSLNEKIDPYLRPLYDALHDMIDPESIPRLMAAGTIEVAPLAYMRGRTLNDAFIILDEAQNTTPEQMKMFLTRLGFGSRIVVTGDVTQIDLPGGSKSGLKVVSQILDSVEDITFCHLDATDVVRHRLVGDIVSAYEKWSDDPQEDTESEHRRTAQHNSGAARERMAARRLPAGTSTEEQPINEQASEPES